MSSHAHDETNIRYEEKEEWKRKKKWKDCRSEQARLLFVSPFNRINKSLVFWVAFLRSLHLTSQLLPWAHLFQMYCKHTSNKWENSPRRDLWSWSSLISLTKDRQWSCHSFVCVKLLPFWDHYLCYILLAPFNVFSVSTRYKCMVKWYMLK